MTNEEIQVNEKEITIQRCPHDKQNPYTMVNRDLIRDNNISPECRWLLIYLLSNNDNWKFKPCQLVKYLEPHMGRTKVYALIDEAIKAGYMAKEDILIDTKRGGKLKGGIRYFVSEFPKFKKCLRYSNFRHTGDRHTGSADNKNNIYKKEHLEEIPITPPIPPQNSESHSAIAEEERISSSSKNEDIETPPPKQAVPPDKKKTKPPLEISYEVKALANKMVIALHHANPHWLIPKNLHHVFVQLNEMIHVENRKPEDILDVFMWAVSDHFWMDKLCKPNPIKYLREQFGQLAGKMNAKPAPKDRKFAPSSNDARTLEKLKEWEKTGL